MTRKDKVDWNHKVNEIAETIRNGIHEINSRYRTGPDLYFYSRTFYPLLLALSCHDLA